MYTNHSIQIFGRRIFTVLLLLFLLLLHMWVYMIGSQWLFTSNNLRGSNLKQPIVYFGSDEWSLKIEGKNFVLLNVNCLAKLLRYIYICNVYIYKRERERERAPGFPKRILTAYCFWLNQQSALVPFSKNPRQ